MGIMGVLFNPNGRIQANQFWKGVIILAGIGIILPILSLYGPTAIAGISGIISFLLLYPYLCVFGKRLHDSGKTAWMSLLFLIAFFVIFFIASTIVFPMIDGYSEIQAELQEEITANGFNLEVMAAYGERSAKLVFIPNMILSLVATFVTAFFCARLYSEPHLNKYGPPVGGEIADNNEDDIFS